MFILCICNILFFDMIKKMKFCIYKGSGFMWVLLSEYNVILVLMVNICIYFGFLVFLFMIIKLK